MNYKFKIKQLRRSSSLEVSNSFWVSQIDIYKHYVGLVDVRRSARIQYPSISLAVVSYICISKFHFLRVSTEDYTTIKKEHQPDWVANERTPAF